MKSFSVSIRTFSKGLLNFDADLRATRHSDLSQFAQATVMDSISMNFYIVKAVLLNSNTYTPIL